MDLEFPAEPEDDGSGRFELKSLAFELEPAGTDADAEEATTVGTGVMSSSVASTSWSASGVGVPEDGVDGEGETGSRPGGECIID